MEGCDFEMEGKGRRKEGGKGKEQHHEGKNKKKRAGLSPIEKHLKTKISPAWEGPMAQKLVEYQGFGEGKLGEGRKMWGGYVKSGAIGG